MDSTEQAVGAMGALDDARLAQAVAAACAGRPALAELRTAALEAAARLWGTPPSPPPAGPGAPLDAPRGSSVPSAPHPDVALGELVADPLGTDPLGADPLGADPVSGRSWAAAGAAELDAESVAGRAAAAEADARARAGRARLDEIRRGMAGSD